MEQEEAGAQTGSSDKSRKLQLACKPVTAAKVNIEIKQLFWDLNNIWGGRWPPNGLIWTNLNFHTKGSQVTPLLVDARFYIFNLLLP